MKIIFASGNKGKIVEVRKLLSDLGIEIIALPDLEDAPEIIEDADTFEGNAKIKAKVVFDKYKLPVIADDSGLSVEQLGGAPGIYSARFAGEGCTYEDNNRKLLEELKNYPEPHRAKFICHAVFYDGKDFVNSVGELKGEIVHEYRGIRGFGYDPIFRPEGYDRNLAELTLEEKNKISHRGKAFRGLKEKLESLIDYN
ncbi:MAG: RdgB/HAM1 family non-canonical purine NTP pyrophosphatase [Chlorobi bacterium]|nr:RdgB/HAM1 family non-canonical purine NTP pyrophosphatase [Chlorobiota bacterium]